MIVVLMRGTTVAQKQSILEELGRLGLRGRELDVLDKPLIHIVGGSARRARRLLRLERVEALVPTSGPRVRRVGRRLYPFHVINWCTAGLLLLGVLVVLAGYRPPGLGSTIDLVSPPSEIGVPWYMRGVQAFVALFPRSLAWLGWLAAATVAATVLLLPRLERTPLRWPAYLLCVALVASWFGLMLWGSM